MSVDPTNIEKADPVLEGGSSFSMLHIIVGTILVGAIVYFFIKKKSSPYTYKKTAKAKVSAVVKKKTILFTGPADSGKTTMVHQLLFGKHVDTVTSMKENYITKALHDDEEDSSSSGPVPTLVDFPGLGNLRGSMLKAAEDCGAIVLVIDSSNKSQSVKHGAEVLYDILTYGPVVSSSPNIMIAFNKADKANSESEENLVQALEEEIDELRTSKEAVVTDNLTGDGDDEELTKDVFVLGTLGRKFSLRLDSPCPVTVCKTSSVKPVDLSKVRDFILDSISH